MSSPITGGEPPTTYQNTIRLGLEDDRIHALILGYWHTIITPPMVFAKLTAEVVEEYRAKGVVKPIVASLVGDTEVEEHACEYLYERGVVAYPYTTEVPVGELEVLGAKYRHGRATPACCDRRPDGAGLNDPHFQRSDAVDAADEMVATLDWPDAGWRAGENDVSSGQGEQA